MTELIEVKEFTLLKVIIVKNVWFVTIGFLTMSLNFEILFVMIVMV